MFYVCWENGEVDENPFSTQEDAEAWISAHNDGLRYFVLTEAEKDRYDSGDDV